MMGMMGILRGLVSRALCETMYGQTVTQESRLPLLMALVTHCRASDFYAVPILRTSVKHP